MGHSGSAMYRSSWGTPCCGAILDTDPDWYDDLRARGALDEVNFWQPRGGKDPTGLPPFAPVLFRLTMRRTGRVVPSGRIVGYGLYVALDAQGHPCPVPPLACETETDRQRDLAAKERQAIRLARREEARRAT